MTNVKKKDKSLIGNPKKFLSFYLFRIDQEKLQVVKIVKIDNL